MTNIITELKTVALKIDNMAADATGSGGTGTTYWTDTTHYQVTVPAGKRWFLLGGHVNRDANATVVIKVRNVAAEQISTLLDEAAGTGQDGYPQTAVAGSSPQVLDAGDYVIATFGAAQGAGAFMSCVVLEIEH